MNLIQSLVRSEQRAVWPPSGAFIDAFAAQLQAMGLNQTLGGKIENIDSEFVPLATRAYSSDGIVFAVMQTRANLFSQARFQWQHLKSGKPADLWGSPALSILEHPWPNGTTADLLNGMIGQADLAGNAFIVKRQDRLVFLRPDWTTIVHGSPDPQGSMWDPDATLLGYGYQPGGASMGRPKVFFLAEEVAHFAPIPDPLAKYRGMSWLTPIIREVMADQAATEHKLAFFENGATVNLVVKIDKRDPKEFDEWVDRVEAQHSGHRNAYRTLYLNPGIDATPIGANMQQIEFKATQGAGETRIAAAGGVPASVVGISEGLQGSALNEGNYSAAMRRFAELTMQTLWMNACSSLETVAPPPSGNRLWFDPSGAPALHVDRQAAAAIRQTDAVSLEILIRAGYTSASSIKALIADGDWTLLEHTGLFSIQLQAPGALKMPEGEVPGEIPVGPGTAPEKPPAGALPPGTAKPVVPIPMNGKAAPVAPKR